MDDQGDRRAAPGRRAATHLLTVSGERHEERHEGYLRQERSVGRFERSMQLPADIRDEDIAASFADGVLTARMPRIAQAQPRKFSLTAEWPAGTAVAGHRPAAGHTGPPQPRSHRRP